MKVNDVVKRRFTLHAETAVCELPERNPRVASPRDHVDGYVPGGRSENSAPPSQG